ncbi:MAG: hypothetical protein ASARMPREDX12_003322 [Alectoria sarmentosa]|nr:MAG: hypothetical protein ASARMPREDX12_003322 [Alectoria sarmentosa]
MSSTAPISPVIDVRSKAAQFYAATITTYGLAVIAVVLRIWARRLMKAQIWVDDWLVAVALLIASGFFVHAVVWFHHDFGQPNELLGEEFGKNSFAEDFLYFLIIGLVKISILAFYWRLFRVSIRIPCYILGAITTCWEITVCIPVSGYWNTKISAKCVNGEHFFLGSSIVNILTDLALLLLPIPYIWRLYRTISQKIALIGIFMLGGFVTIISIIRITILFKLDVSSLNLIIDFVGFVSWGIAESNMAIVAACLPSLRPILSLILYGEPNPSIQGPKGSGLGRSWTRIQPSVAAKPHHGQSTSAGDGLQRFSSPRDNGCGFSGEEQFHGNTLTYTRDRETHEHEDIEMQMGRHQLKSGIHVRSDVTVQ